VDRLTPGGVPMRPAAGQQRDPAVTMVPTPGGLSTVSVPSIVGRRPRRPTSPIPFGPRLTSRDPSGCHRHHRDAVASLWPVDDLATALLMTPVYEELFAAPHSLPEALRRAQLWLRDLTADGARAFLDAHPALAAERRRRGDKITNGGDMAPGANVARPYAHPDFWAPFIAVGA
jgi:hypothetical protein